jgi:tetratricopeptide (TPR) repeat protein
MNPKASAAIEKACEDRRHSNFKKALSRLEEGIEKFPKEIRLYTEAIDVSMESGEPLKAIQFFKKAQQKFPDDGFELWTFTAEKVRTYNDPIVGRFLLEHAIRSGDLAAASSVLEGLTDHAVGELLERIRTKKQTVSGSVGTGFSAREDIVSYTLTEALLCLRLSRFSEAMDGFVRALGENPGSSKALAPFLADVEQRHGQIGETSYALGCCYLASAAYSKGLDKLVHAARIAPPLAPRAIERIESLGEHPEIPVDARNLNLAQLYIGLGGLRQAADLLSATLDHDSLKAPDIIDMLRPVVENVGDDLEPQFLFVEASFAAGRRETALGQLRKIYQKRTHRSRLIEWLESRSQANRGSTEIQLFFAETALNEGLHGKAIEIVKEILSRGREEEPAVKELLSKHQSAPLIRHFYNERFSVSLAREKRSASEFERYENPGFPPADAATSAQKEPGDRGTPHPEGTLAAGNTRLGVDELSFGQEEDPRPPRAVDPRRSDFDNRDFSLSMHAAPNADATAERAAPESPDAFADPADGFDLFDYLKRDFDAQEPPTDEREKEPAPAAPENGTTVPEDNFSGLSADRQATAPDEQVSTPHQPVEPAADRETTALVEPAQPTADHEITAPAEPADFPRDFDSLCQLILDGRLDRSRILEVVDRAFEEGRMEEMKKLLSFEPATLGEDIARKYQLARYYLAKDQPMPALVALKTVPLNRLGREERKDFLLRIADCYRALHNFEAAHGVYLRIMSEYPGLSDVQSIAQSNYDKYIETAAGAALALEKTSNL